MAIPPNGCYPGNVLADRRIQPSKLPHAKRALGPQSTAPACQQHLDSGLDFARLATRELALTPSRAISTVGALEIGATALMSGFDPGSPFWPSPAQCRWRSFLSIRPQSPLAWAAESRMPPSSHFPD